MANKLISDITAITALKGSDQVEVESGGSSYSATLSLLNLVAAKSADYTITDSDGIRYLNVTTADTDRTMTLPTASDNTNRVITIKKVDSGTGKVTIDGEGSETIDELTTFLLIDKGQWVTIVCDGSGWQSVAWSSPPIMILEDQKSSGTNGGTFTSGAWRTRDLNTEVYNNIPGGVLSSNQITLPAGSYEIYASAPAYRVQEHRIRWRNITDGTSDIWGESSYVDDTDVVVDRTNLFGRISSSSEKVFELQHEASRTQNTDGFGVETGDHLTIDHETYSHVVIKKIG
jgi:hypothetical protein